MAEKSVTDSQRVLDDLAYSAGPAVEVTVAAEPDHLPILRSVAESTLYLDDWPIDDVADVVLGIDEICTRIIAASAAEYRMTMSIAVGPRGAVGSVSGSLAPGFELDISGFGWHVVRTVTDAQSIDYAGDEAQRDVTVHFAKRRGWS